MRSRLAFLLPLVFLAACLAVMPPGTTLGQGQVSQGINAVLDTVTPSGVKTSNGTTAVVVAAATASKKVYVAKLSVYNKSTATVTHTIDVISSGGTVLTEVILAPGGGFFVDDTGFLQSSAVGEGLSFKIDAGGTSTDCVLTASTVTK